jgi:hypothetical protein
MWVNHKNVRKWSSVVFNPFPQDHAFAATNDVLNTWQGLQVTKELAEYWNDIFQDHPRRAQFLPSWGELNRKFPWLKDPENNIIPPGSPVNYCVTPGQLLTLHILNIWCKRDYKLCDYFISWMASLVQRPWVKVDTALVVLGIESCGKGSVLRALSHIVGGNHYFESSDINDIVGNYTNSELASALLFNFDEGTKPLDDALVAKLKNIITEPTLRVRPLYSNVTFSDNFIRMILTTNEKNSVPRERAFHRWVQVSCSHDAVGATEYFAMIYKFLGNDIYFKDKKYSLKLPHVAGAADFAHMLYNYDISEWNSNTLPPTTDDMLESYAIAIPPVANYILELIQRKITLLDRSLARKWDQQFTFGNDPSNTETEYNNHCKQSGLETIFFITNSLQIDDELRQKLCAGALELLDFKWRTIVPKTTMHADYLQWLEGKKREGMYRNNGQESMVSFFRLMGEFLNERIGYETLQCLEWRGGDAFEYFSNKDSDRQFVTKAAQVEFVVLPPYFMTLCLLSLSTRCRIASLLRAITITTEKKLVRDVEVLAEIVMSDIQQLSNKADAARVKVDTTKRSWQGLQPWKDELLKVLRERANTALLKDSDKEREEANIEIEQEMEDEAMHYDIANAVDDVIADDPESTAKGKEKDNL